MTRYAHKRDANHGEIQAALEEIGVGVVDTSGLGEFVDLVTFQRGIVRLIEIKDGAKVPSARKLTPAQIRLHEAARLHCCQVHVVTDVLSALILHGARP